MDAENALSQVGHAHLDHKTVQGRPEDPIVVIAVDELWMCHGLLCLHPVDYPLVQVGSGNVPRLSGEEYIVGVVNLGQVVEGAPLLWVWQRVCANGTRLDCMQSKTRLTYTDHDKHPKYARVCVAS
jgi:hypothetical protein